jgi:hypothetical protein
MVARDLCFPAGFAGKGSGKSSSNEEASVQAYLAVFHSGVLGDRLWGRSKPSRATQREKKYGLGELVTRNWEVSICPGRSQARRFGKG